MMIRTLLLLLALAPVVYDTPRQPPPFAALWAGPDSARLSWQQPPNIHATCLYRNTTLIRCWRDERAGLFVVTLGSVGPLDGNLRPTVGDTYSLTQDGAIARAPLRWALWLPGMAKPPAVVGWRLWLGMVRRG